MNDEVKKQKDNLEFIQEVKGFIENIDLFKQNGIYTEDDKENSKTFYGTQPAYPYLKHTFDETNLKKMLCKKRKTEKLVDEFKITIDDVEKVYYIIKKNEKI